MTKFKCNYCGMKMNVEAMKCVACMPGHAVRVKTMTDAQREAIKSFCERNPNNGPFNENDYKPATNMDGLPDGYYVGFLSGMHFGCCPEGRIST